jgi:head-tail adaptor
MVAGFVPHQRVAFPVNRGAFDRLVAFQVSTPTTDDYGGEVHAWATVEEAWARVRFGRADEKREAAQEAGSQSATFEMAISNALMSVTLRDRLWYDNSPWDITEKADLDRQIIRLTAARAV